LNTSAPIQYYMELKTDQDETVTCIECSQSGKFIVFGTNTGHIKLCVLETNLITKYRMNHVSITSIDLTSNDEYLVAGCSDGLIGYWKVDDVLRPSCNTIPNWSDHVLINKHEYSERIKAIQTVQSDLHQKQCDDDISLKDSERIFKKKIEDLAKNSADQLSVFDAKIKELTTVRDVQNAEQEAQIKALIGHYTAQMVSNDEMHKARLKVEDEKICIMKEKTDQLKIQVQLSKSQNELKANGNLDVFRLEFDRITADLEQTHSEKMFECTQKLEALEAYRENYEEEIDLELFEVKRRFERELRTVTDLNDTLREESIKLKRQLDIQVAFLS
jgi:hypothetical protein